MEMGWEGEDGREEVLGFRDLGKITIGSYPGFSGHIAFGMSWVAFDYSWSEYSMSWVAFDYSWSE